MAVDKETRILKSNTIEQLRQKANEVSLHVGDTDQLDNLYGDKVFDYANVSVGTEAMYEKGANELFSLSKNKGGDAVIFANFEYRIALSGSGETAKQVQELFCYGTAVKFTS